MYFLSWNCLGHGYSRLAKIPCMFTYSLTPWFRGAFRQTAFFSEELGHWSMEELCTKAADGSFQKTFSAAWSRVSEVKLQSWCWAGRLQFSAQGWGGWKWYEDSFSDCSPLAAGEEEKKGGRGRSGLPAWPKSGLVCKPSFCSQYLTGKRRQLVLWGFENL